MAVYGIEAVELFAVIAGMYGAGVAASLAVFRAR